jgi:predicted SprT family Zn-dependent metalloprotease
MIHRKRTQKDITDQRILDMWTEVKEEARHLYPQYFQNCEPELYQDDSYSHLGRCSWSLANPSERNIDKVKYTRCIITISSMLGQDYDEIRDTLCHELGHFVAPRENHSYLWKARSNKIGQRWGISVSRTSNNETFTQAAKKIKEEVNVRNPYKYRVFCPECGVEWKYKTNCQIVKYPWLYRCHKCKIDLKSEKI